MSRILRNYMISFIIIGLFFLAVHLINRMVEQRMESSPGGSAASGEPGFEGTGFGKKSGPAR